MIPNNKIGLNANLGAPRDINRLVRVARAMNPRVHLLMTGGNSNEYAKERQDVISIINQIGNPDTLYIHRFFSSRQGEWPRFSLEEIDRRWSQTQTHPQIIEEVPANEPNMGDTPEFVQNQIALLKLAYKHNRRLATGIWGVGGPHESLIRAGRFADQYRACNDYGGFVETHEYAKGWLEAGSRYGYEILLKPEHLTQYWDKKWEIRQNHYLLRRSDEHYIYCQEHNIPCPPFIIGECMLDNVPDAMNKLNANNMAGDKLGRDYGLPEFNFDLRGVNTYRKYFAQTWPELTYPQAIQKLLVHYQDDVLWPEYIYGACLFAWNTIWYDPEGHDYSVPEMEAPLVAMGKYNEIPLPAPQPQPQPIPVPIPEPTPIPLPIPIPQPETTKAVRIRGKHNRINIRQAPGLTQAIVGILSQTYIPAEIGIEPEANLNGYSWHSIAFLDGIRIVRGYFAIELVEIAEIGIIVELTQDEAETLKTIAAKVKL